MTPDVRVDAAGLAVHVGERAFGFEVDLGTGEATCAGRVLRPLRWREKVTLARYAAEVGDAVDDALVTGRLSGDALDGVGDDVRAALVAVARWLNGWDPAERAAPAGSPRDVVAAAPLDPHALARLEAAAARGSGLAPAELGALSAPTVELLARAAPVPSPPGAAAAAPPEPVLAVPTSATRVTPMPGAGTPAAAASPPIPGSAPRTESAPWPAAFGDPPEGVTRIVILPDPEPAATEPEAADTPVARAIPAAEPPAGPPHRLPDATPAPLRGLRVAAPARRGAAANVRPPAPDALPRNGFHPPERTAGGALAARPAPAAAPDPAPAPAPQLALVRPAPVAPAVTADVDVDAILDELARRLDAAVDDLGLDPGH